MPEKEKPKGGTPGGGIGATIKAILDALKGKRKIEFRPGKKRRKAEAEALEETK